MSRATGREPLSKPLSVAFRLQRRQDFVRFFEGSSVARFPSCVVFRASNELSHFRLGITLKIKSESIERNLLRRRIREVFRNLGPALGSFDYNVVIRNFRRPMRLFARKLAEELSVGLPTTVFYPTSVKAKRNSP